jgi:hypothetical protein
MKLSLKKQRKSVLERQLALLNQIHQVQKKISGKEITNKEVTEYPSAVR